MLTLQTRPVQNVSLQLDYHIMLINVSYQS